MNILYIWDADYPWDVRVEKICTTLKNNGHNVHIAARNLKKRKTNEFYNGLHIHRMTTWENNKINYLLSFPLFFSPIWKSFLKEVISSNNINLIIVRDLPMVIAGIVVGKKFGIPVIFDMAEDYVAMIRDIWNVRKFKGLNLIIRNPYLAKLVEYYALKHVDHILVVVKEAKEELEKRSCNSENITIVSNTPELKNFNNVQCKNDNSIKLIKNRYSVIYTGGVQMGRGVQVVLEAIPKLKKNIPDFLLVIAGDGYAKEILDKIIEEKKLQKHVLWLGWIEHAKIYDYIRASKIGLIPHLVTNHVNTTIPNKIFDYMGCGIPVIASDALPMKRVLQEEQCGLTFKSGNSESLVNAILDLSAAKYEYGKNGEKAVRYRYNWTEDEKRLCSVVNKFRN